MRPAVWMPEPTLPALLLAVLAGLAAPLALAAVLVPFRGSFPNTDAALAMLAVAFADQVGAALASSHPVGQR